MRLRLYVAAVLSIASFLPAQALPKMSPWSATLQVDVSADPPALQEELESYILREVRDLRDIEVVKDKGRFRLLVNAIENRNRRGAVIGVDIATIVEMPWDWSLLSSVLSGLSPENRAFVEGFQSLSLRGGFDLHVGPRDALATLCREIVLKLDTRTFEPARKQYRELLDLARKRGAIQ
jgi:hypothetical protein